MYVEKIKRVKNYEASINLREYKKSKRVLKENDTKVKYDRKSQIACLGGSNIREEPIDKYKNAHNFGTTSKVYMNEHMWNKNIFTGPLILAKNNKERGSNKENV